MGYTTKQGLFNTDLPVFSLSLGLLRILALVSFEPPT